MSNKEKAVPLYLQDKDGHVRLYAADDVEAARINGWTDTVGKKSNGEPWNVPAEEGEQSIAEATAVVAKANAERQAKIDKRKADEAEAARKALGDLVTPPKKADMVVEIVQPEAPAKGKK